MTRTYDRPQGEMLVSDADPDVESPDLGLWVEFLDPDDVVELERLARERRA